MPAPEAFAEPEASPDAIAASVAKLARNPEALQAAALHAVLQARQDGGGLDLGGIGDLLKDVLGSIGPLLDLLNPETFKAIQTLLKNGASLLDDEGTKKAKNLVGNANNLLTPEFVTQTKGLIADVAPLVGAVAQLISAVISSLLG
ncbi:hypothetical protein FQN55_000542 [Onygenales sp. PD_40]|nr:hypothetical protein FQN55_000542 [Onygenales sp. PD_40]KAK2786771.1 hypothetical protein FQN52_007657 [Onygenales sp. PD_12]KAK2800176.1 hypothetical protein FQN51_006252 [Onygenales sp. PD_10]